MSTLNQTAACLLALALAAAPAAAGSDPACAEVPGVEALLDGPRVVLVGELHGTEESPGFVAALVCQAVRSGKSVTVGLEWVEAETARVEAYLDSAGGADARSALLAGGIWQAPGQAQYGATSQAMVALLESLRQLRRGGHDIDVGLFNRYGRSSQERDRLMAETLAALIQRSKADLFVALTGNIHSRVAPGTRWDPEFEPMGLLLRRAHPDWKLVSLDVAHSGGTAWLCISGEPCGARRQSQRGETADAPFTVSLDDEVQANGHHGHYYVGSIQASPPAVSGADPGD